MAVRGEQGVVVEDEVELEFKPAEARLLAGAMLDGIPEKVETLVQLFGVQLYWMAGQRRPDSPYSSMVAWLESQGIANAKAEQVAKYTFSKVRGMVEGQSLGERLDSLRLCGRAAVNSFNKAGITSAFQVYGTLLLRLPSGNKAQDTASAESFLHGKVQKYKAAAKALGEVLAELRKSLPADRPLLTISPREALSSQRMEAERKSVPAKPIRTIAPREALSSQRMEAGRESLPADKPIRAIPPRESFSLKLMAEARKSCTGTCVKAFLSGSWSGDIAADLKTISKADAALLAKASVDSPYVLFGEYLSRLSKGESANKAKPVWEWLRDSVALDAAVAYHLVALLDRLLAKCRERLQDADGFPWIGRARTKMQQLGATRQYSPRAARVSVNQMEAFRKANLEGSVTTVPSIGEVGAAGLKEKTRKKTSKKTTEGMTTAMELVGEFLKLRKRGLKEVDACRKFFHWITDSVPANCRNSIVYSVNELVAIMLPSI